MTASAGAPENRRKWGIMALAGDWLVSNLATLWYRLDRRHRQITLANLKFAYGADLSHRRAGAPGPAGLRPFRAPRLGDGANCSWPRWQLSAER